jgi:hypothetical protein
MLKRVQHDGGCAEALLRLKKRDVILSHQQGRMP